MVNQFNFFFIPPCSGIKRLLRFRHEDTCDALYWCGSVRIDFAYY